MGSGMNGAVAASNTTSSARIAERRKGKASQTLNLNYWIKILCKAFANDRFYSVLCPLKEANVVRMLPIGTEAEKDKAILVITLDDTYAYDETKLAKCLEVPGFQGTDLTYAKTMLGAMGIIRLPDHTDTSGQKQRLYYAPERTNGLIISQLRAEHFRATGRLRSSDIQSRVEDWIGRVVGRAGHPMLKELAIPGYSTRLSSWFNGFIA